MDLSGPGRRGPLNYTGRAERPRWEGREVLSDGKPFKYNRNVDRGTTDRAYSHDKVTRQVDSGLVFSIETARHFTLVPTRWIGPVNGVGRDREVMELESKEEVLISG